MKKIIVSFCIFVLSLLIPPQALAIGSFDARDVRITVDLITFKLENLDRSNDGNNGGYDGKVIYSTLYCYNDDILAAHTDAVGIWNTNDLVSYTPTNYDGTSRSDCVIRINTNSGLNDYESRQHFSIPTVPSISPSPSPSISGAPVPFLDLPFDYQGKKFEQVALNPESWFDHSYPLQNIICCVMKVLIYTGEESNNAYRSHSGYDYARRNGIILGTPILAAASGVATFLPWQKSGGAGNMIKIDHGNGYQTWYEHLSSEGLIISVEGNETSVQKGQQIGKVGMTGNTNGPHIHFSVFNDSNNNKLFTDDYPYGLIDPLGWESESIDPWTKYGNGQQHGATSYDLFLSRAKPIIKTISKDEGGSIASSSATIIVPQNASPLDFTITLKDGPFENDGILESIVPSFFLSAKNSLGDKITEFLKPIEISYNYADAELLNIDQDSLKLYHFNEKTNRWDPLPTKSHNKATKTISAQTNHFSHFALMGRIKDNIAPTTEITLQGEKGQNGWYRSNVSVSLASKDNDKGIGLQYTLYTLNGNDWYEYTKPIIFKKEGQYTITYQSFDKANNKGERKTNTFSIDKTPPEALIQFDLKKKDIVISPVEPVGKVELKEKELKRNQEEITLIDSAGNTLLIEDRDRDHSSNAILNLFSLSYNGNKVSLDRNRFAIQYQDDKNKMIKIFTQLYQERNGDKIKLIYQPKVDKTTIVEDGQTRDVAGMKILQLLTVQGEIQYQIK